MPQLGGAHGVEVVPAAIGGQQSRLRLGQDLRSLGQERQLTGLEAAGLAAEVVVEAAGVAGEEAAEGLQIGAEAVADRGAAATMTPCSTLWRKACRSSRTC